MNKYLRLNLVFIFLSVLALPFVSADWVRSQSCTLDCNLSVEDSNETTRFDALTGYDCPSGQLAIGVQDNGTILCGVDVGSNYDQDLNTTSNVIFNNLSISGEAIFEGAAYFRDNVTLTDTNALWVNESLVLYDVAGDSKIVLNASGDSWFENTNKLGLGTNSPDKAIHLRHTDNNGMTTDRVNSNTYSGHTFVANGAVNERWFFGMPASSDNLVFRSRSTNNVMTIEDQGTADSLYIKSNGYVGIGTTTPDEKFVVEGDAQITNQLGVGTASTTSGITINSTDDATNAIGIVRASSSGRSQISLQDEDGGEVWRYGMTSSGGSDFNFYDQTQNALVLKQNGDIVMTPAGNVGIGTSDPISLLHIESATSPSFYANDTTNGVTFQMYAQDSDAHIGSRTNHPFVFDIESSEVARFDTSGYFGIGTTNPLWLLSVENDNNNATNTMAIRNTNNSEGSLSDAELFIETGGANGGDPTTHYQIDAVTSWSTGIDNSDDDKYKIAYSNSLGTNDVLFITTAGLVGIGATPTEGLDVVGTGKFLSTSASQLQVAYDGSNSVGLDIPAAGGVNFITSGSSPVFNKDGSPICVNDGTLVCSDYDQSTFGLQDVLTNDALTSLTAFFNGGLESLNITTAQLDVNGPFSSNGAATFGELGAVFNGLADFNVGATALNLTMNGPLYTAVSDTGAVLLDTVDGSIGGDSSNLVVTPTGSVELNNDLDVNGNVTDNNYYGEMYSYQANSTAWTFAIADQGVYYNLTGDIQEGDLNGMSFTNQSSAQGGSQLTVDVAGRYHVSATISADTTASSLFAFAVVHDYDVTTHRECYSRRDVTKNNVGSVSISCLMDIDEGEKVNLQVENEESASDLIIHTMNLNLWRVGD
jgi:hypothetical protein